MATGPAHGVARRHGIIDIVSKSHPSGDAAPPARKRPALKAMLTAALLGAGGAVIGYLFGIRSDVASAASLLTQRPDSLLLTKVAKKVGVSAALAGLPSDSFHCAASPMSPL